MAGLTKDDAEPQGKQVADIIATNIRNGTNWVKLSRKLYDGYNAGREMNTAQLPAYLNRLRYYAKQTLSMGLQPDVETMYKYNKALQRAKKLVDEMSDKRVVLMETYLKIVTDMKVSVDALSALILKGK